MLQPLPVVRAEHLLILNARLDNTSHKLVDVMVELWMLSQ